RVEPLLTHDPTQRRRSERAGAVARAEARRAVTADAPGEEVAVPVGVVGTHQERAQRVLDPGPRVIQVAALARVDDLQVLVGEALTVRDQLVQALPLLCVAGDRVEAVRARPEALVEGEQVLEEERGLLVLRAREARGEERIPKAQLSLADEVLLSEAVQAAAACSRAPHSPRASGGRAAAGS